MSALERCDHVRAAVVWFICALDPKADAQSVWICVWICLGLHSDQLLHYIASHARNIQELNLCGVKSVSADVRNGRFHLRWEVQLLI